MEDHSDEILGFISRFLMDGNQPRQEVLDTFLSGCCYWFARLLAERFASYVPELMYDSIDCHFGCRILGTVYDITGDATSEHNWERWTDVYAEDPLHGQRILRDCANFVD